MNRDIHNRKTDEAFRQLEQSSIWRSNYNQPFYKLCLTLGFKVKPPHYASYLENVLANGIPFGVFWGILMWFMLWAHQSMPWWGAVLASIAAVLVYGCSMATYFRYSHRKNGLTSWEEL